MSNLQKRAEVAANIAIVVVAVVLCVVLVKRFVLDKPDPGPRQAANQLAAGDKVPVGMEWVKGGQTVLLVLQKGCRYCTESAPFYQRLIKETANRSDVKVIAVLPQPVAEGKQYLDEIGVSIADIRQISPGDIRVGGTPTIVLVDENGVAINVWKGKLPPDREAEVLSKLKVG